jgi:hypothetical protein
MSRIFTRIVHGCYCAAVRSSPRVESDKTNESAMKEGIASADGLMMGWVCADHFVSLLSKRGA